MSPRTRLIPLGVAALTLLLLAAEMVFSTWWTFPSSSLPAPPPGTTSSRSPVAVSSAQGELVVFFWVLLCPLFIWLLGFAAGVPSFTVLFLRAFSRREFWEAVILALVLWLVIYHLSGRPFELFLYEGWVWKLL